MLEARDLYCERDERTLFRGLSFTVDAGEWVQVTGGNGAGKTTLLRLLTGLARPDGGEVLVSRDHTDIRVLSLYAFSAFEQQRFGEAVAAWEMMLKLLPAGDARRAVIERSIRLAQEK
ncbi:ATP-binding cassette domain-containing protein [Salmonella enterica]|uniref:ATP-binding cassette domain-containing protein n=1 Tax=Salmonella enterica TaxID=28901 RepID=UPI0021C39F4E|nr:ATP-binding cassette domain-containing protein [Salmonella enterica]